MRILYVIFTGSKSGVGGHYYDLKTIACVVGKSHDVMIMCIGPHHSPVIAASELDYQCIHFNGTNFISAYRGIERIVSRFKPDIIHSFDLPSFLFVRFVRFRYDVKIVFTKCGGENPKIYWPYAPNIILFSDENGDYFRQKEKYRSSKISIIPHRVAPVKNDIRKINSIMSMVPLGKIVFLRISRFRRCYERSFVQLITLFNDLNAQLRNKCFLVIIGGIEDSGVYNTIARLKNDSMLLLTSDDFTLNAVQLIDCADFVLGTGRGLMEAAAKGKVLLTPLCDSKYPLLVTEDNFDAVFRTNFSPRNQVKGFSDEKNFMSIVKAVNDQQYRNRFKVFSRSMFERYFDVNVAIDEYNTFYRGLFLSNSRSFFAEIMDIVLHVLYVLRICVVRGVMGI